MNTPSDKTAIRQEMRRRRRALSSEEKARAAAIVCDKILADTDVNEVLDSLWENGICAVYLASPDEIDLSAAIRAILDWGATVVAPRWNGETYELAKLKSLEDGDLRKGPMGILEPKDADIVSPKEVTAWLVPGLAFTRNGERLGYGGGWYDRLMADAGKGALKFGIAHAFQVVDSLPSEPHDIRLDGVIDDSLDHPQIDFTELEDGCRVRVSIANRNKWRSTFFGGIAGLTLSLILLATAAKFKSFPHAGGIALLSTGVIVLLAGGIAVLHALSGPFEAELEVNGEKGICRRKWLGLVPLPTRHFDLKPWMRFTHGIRNPHGIVTLGLHEGAITHPLFRCDSEVALLLSIRLNRFRTFSAEQLRAAQEKLLAHLPKGMSISRDERGATVTVQAPALIVPGQFLLDRLSTLLFAVLLLRLLDPWPMLMLSLTALALLLFLMGLARRLLGRCRLTIQGESCTYIEQLWLRQRRQTFMVNAQTMPVTLEFALCLEDAEGGDHLLFEYLPNRHYLYLKQFLLHELPRH